MSILEVNDLKKHFPIKSGVLKRTTGWVYAVDGVSFSIEEGETPRVVPTPSGGRDADDAEGLLVRPGDLEAMRAGGR